ncbi:MAG: hypothetical protein IPJ74_13590 [Saprospiraceae bacterium]|nr:hypothetical protein [Saprospiraceae bacterium]
MSLQKKFILLLMILLGAQLASFAQKHDDISQFEWMVGKWKYQEQNSIYEEYWEKMDEKLECTAFSINGKDTVSREHFRIEKLNNQWTFVGIVENGTPSFFNLVNTKNKLLSFEKKEESFPKRINYAQKGDLLTVWIEGNLNGQPMKFEYPMRKIE